MATLRLKRLQIDRFRNVAPGTVLVFNDGKNVLLGPNGSGKTTLLRLIAAAAFDDFEFLAGEDLDITYDVDLSTSLFRIHLVNRRGNGGLARRPTTDEGNALSWQLDIELHELDGEQAVILQGNPFAMTVPISQTPRPVRDPFSAVGPLAQAVSALFVLAEILAKTTDPVRNVELHNAISQAWHHVAGLVKSRVSLMVQGGRFDEGLGMFAAIVDGSIAEQSPDRLFVSLDRSETIDTGFVPREIRLAVDALPKDAIGSDITLTHDTLPFLQRVVHLFGGREARMILRLREKSEDGAESFSNFEFLFTLDDGTIIRHDLLSWGQKRILSFFYYAAANPDILVVDELVNGLHHEWIAACLKEMEGRQCFLTSQNPLLLDQLVFSSPEDVRGTFIQCRREKQGERRAELHWQPMDEASAESFFRAYSVGIQHVGEILRTKGLW